MPVVTASDFYILSAIREILEFSFEQQIKLSSKGKYNSLQGALAELNKSSELLQISLSRIRCVVFKSYMCMIVSEQLSKHFKNMHTSHINIDNARLRGIMNSLVLRPCVAIFNWRDFCFYCVSVTYCNNFTLSSFLLLLTLI